MGCDRLAKSGAAEVSGRARAAQERRSRNCNDKFEFLSLCWLPAALIASHKIQRMSCVPLARVCPDGAKVMPQVYFCFSKILAVL